MQHHLLENTRKTFSEKAAREGPRIQMSRQRRPAKYHNMVMRKLRKKKKKSPENKLVHTEISIYTNMLYAN